MMTARRIARTVPSPAPVPVICVGNLTLGGTGKTPVSLALIEMAKQIDLKPASLSRGWGGRTKTPTKVDLAIHSYKDVGDEPLLLAERTDAFIDPKRVGGASLAEQSGADLIVMDDGHQNPTLEKTLSVVVVDGVAGWGARKVFPAGPLREPVDVGLSRADAVIIMGADPSFEPDYGGLGLADLEIPVLKAWLEPEAPPPSGPLIAFAGIGRPQKFFEGLVAAGAEIADTASFPDHHSYTKAELDRLADLASAHTASLVTTRKDWVRLPSQYRGSVAAYDVSARFETPERVSALIETALDRFKKSR
jgi:tetraacyldisaccharide 4'-kinase